jgi:type I restriction enzyme M protein
VKLKDKSSIVRYVELSDVSSQYNEIINESEYVVHELPSRASYDIETGDIITSVAGNSIGTENHASALVTEEYDGCVCTNGFRVLVPNKKVVNPYFLVYYLKSKYFLDQVFRYRTGAAIPSLLDSDLLNILVLLPSIEEQNRIGDIIKEGFEERKKFRNKIKDIKINEI